MDLPERLYNGLGYLLNRVKGRYYHNQDGTFSKAAFMEALRFHLLDDLDVRLIVKIGK